MKRIDVGCTGEPVNPNLLDWDDLELSARWSGPMKVLCPHGKPTELQAIALGTSRILESRRNLIISAPRNTGKSLLGYSVLLESVLRGRRAFCLHLAGRFAQEKFDDLERVLPQLIGAFGRKIAVTITTGDYRLDEEAMTVLLQKEERLWLQPPNGLRRFCAIRNTQPGSNPSAPCAQMKRIY